MIDLNNLGKKPYKKEKPKPPKVERTHYMPDEDEVYIGAEFVLRHRKTGKTKVEIYNGHVSPKLYLSRAGISVTKKYLDKEDIESLGFVEIGQEYYSLGEGETQVRIEALHPFPLYRVEFGEGFLFMGIKSKDDLKRILKMLNI
jgi:hypothetical protein